MRPGSAEGSWAVCAALRAWRGASRVGPGARRAQLSGPVCGRVWVIVCPAAGACSLCEGLGAIYSGSLTRELLIVRVQGEWTNVS